MLQAITPCTKEVVWPSKTSTAVTKALEYEANLKLKIKFLSVGMA